jgi:hypothetical protein
LVTVCRSLVIYSAVLTPLPTTLKSDRLGIGLKPLRLLWWSDAR